MESSVREPESFAQGDTLSFKRVLPEYPSGQGWSLTYEIRGGAQPTQFTSTEDADGITHDIYVAPAVTATWLPGTMFLVGYVGNGTDRYQIYYGELTIYKNLEGSTGDVPVKTMKQVILENMEKCLLNFATSGLLETRIGETMFRYTTVKDLYWAYGLAYQARQNEIQSQRAANRKIPGNKIRPRAKVTAPGVLVGQAGWPYYGGTGW